MISFNDALGLINSKILQIEYPKHSEGLYAPIRYILSLKGKKIRPILTLLAYNLYREDNWDDVIQPALAWEIFHNFTLMHDDLMDNADMRRAQPTVHNVWDRNTAILSGDAMLILSYQYMAKAPEKYLKVLMDLFSMTAAEICEGQQLDMEFENRLDVGENEYLEMIRLKTAVLLGAALKTGVVIGGGSGDDARNIYDFGMNIGLAFQIKDDLLDVYGDPTVFGKNIGGDIRSNKKTYLLIQALLLAKNRDKDDLLYWVGKEECDPEEKIKAVTDIYSRIGIRKIAESKMDYFYEKALESLSLLKISAEKKSVLLELAEKLMIREF